MNDHGHEHENDSHDDDRAYDVYDDHDGEGHEDGGSGRGPEPAARPVERTFAALPPVAGGGFARSWWGRAWVGALEGTALDSAQLTRGRRIARSGAVGAMSVRPGRITAVVRDRDGTGHRADVLLTELTAPAWERFLDMAVESAGHIAALLDHEMPPHLVEDAATAGVDLLPGVGDLEGECGCGAWDVCPHTAALAYQVARLLDRDPWVLLLVRGRDERRLVDELQARSAARATPSRADGAAEVRTPRGVPADRAYAARVPGLPPLPPVPTVAGSSPALDTETAPPAGVDPRALEFLAADAAARARRMLLAALAPDHGDRPLDPPLTPDQDAVRLAAAAPGAAVLGRLATGGGRQRAGLETAARAWRAGGTEALAVLDGTDAPGPAVLERAAAALESAWEAAERPRLRAAGPGRWTVVGHDAQLRTGADGRWWPFRREAGRWVPAGPAAADPESALADALGETG
ncbi:SWF or SNF family helicase [Streptomyces sp. NPDC000594]|uniref:SWF or SNF family helicase n=1 Tax=Streptomyces sp. NPDC000594 TaxID=3154261 RepID=UPI0033184BC8